MQQAEDSFGKLGVSQAKEPPPEQEALRVLVMRARRHKRKPHHQQGLCVQELARQRRQADNEERLCPLALC
jgi:hypothetical protein